MEEKILTDKFVEDELHWWNVPGVTLGICQDGRALQVEGFGFRDIAEKLPMTGETLGGIASCSKSFMMRQPRRSARCVTCCITARASPVMTPCGRTTPSPERNTCAASAFSSRMNHSATRRSTAIPSTT